MCGIAGYLGTRPLDETPIRACLAQMRRRGPDHASWHQCASARDRYAYLLFTRLSIIDLDPRANQPFCIGSKWMTYNGELYNYLELRNDLQREGHTFSTTSDTEVLLRAIDAWGWGALDRFEGMWALAVYDEADRSLTLARDRFGEKPLYIWSDGPDLYFGSEVKFLVSLAGRKPDVNLNQLFRYLVNGYKALYKSDESFYHGISEVPPATIVRIDATGSRVEHRYWQLGFCPAETMSYGDAVDGARARLIRSVGLRLRADVPLAFCMSGGVDSNALISIAKNVYAYDVHGFTIVNEDEWYDEQELVRCAVSAQDLRHTAVPVNTEKFLPNLRELVRHHDAPVSTITYYAHWQLMQVVAQHGYRISVSGTAADELFSGYYDHHLAYFYDVREDATIHGPARAGWSDHVQPMVRNPFLKDPDLFIKDPGFRDYIYLDAEEFAGYLRHRWEEPFEERPYSSSVLRNRMLNELLHENVPAILHEDDLNAMYFSVENRSPYLDRELAEFCYRIPTRHLMGDGYAKRVLRDAVHGIAPDAIVENRRKVGFNASIFSFLNVADDEVRSAILDDSPVFEYIHRAKIESLIRRDHLPNSESKFMFYFLSAKMFLEEVAA
jgi:asparagine synthase (glutamine-hydrolysing)